MNSDDRKALKRLDRADRKANDPWFGKRRKTGMEGNRRAIAAKQACRKGAWA